MLDDGEDVGDQPGPDTHRRLLARLDHMVESGRVTEDEAARLRAADGPQEIDHAVGAIRLRHAGARLDAAVADGDMSREEADGFLERLRNGEHPRGLRSDLAKLRPRRHSPGP
ncbi:MAG TPA: hypothetical protein VHS52_01110 [Acidimicrobiales bacterium]|nr:hypothetical protein [Acidimicrobiales bacterium]